MKNKIIKFMENRYGVDELCYGFIRIYLIISVINIIFISKLILYISLLILFITIYRILSQNIYKRQNENIKYLKIKRTINKKLNSIKDMYNDKEHIYHKCFKCKTILKLPRPFKIGIRHAKCPNCKKRLIILVLRKQKLVTISKK